MDAESSQAGEGISAAGAEAFRRDGGNLSSFLDHSQAKRSRDAIQRTRTRVRMVIMVRGRSPLAPRDPSSSTLGHYIVVFPPSATAHSPQAHPAHIHASHEQALPLPVAPPVWPHSPRSMRRHRSSKSPVSFIQLHVTAPRLAQEKAL